MNPEQRITQFANVILRNGALELKDPDELVAACCMVIAGSFREGITENEVDAALTKVIKAIKMATGNTGNNGVSAN